MGDPLFHILGGRLSKFQLRQIFAAAVACHLIQAFYVPGSDPSEVPWVLTSLSQLSQGWLVSWFFEPSQAQRITSGLKTNFSLSSSYSAHKSSNHKFSHIYARKCRSDICGASTVYTSEQDLNSLTMLM